MGLHVELAPDAGIVVDHQIVDAKSVQLFAASETCGSCTDDGHGGLIDFELTMRIMITKSTQRILIFNHLHLFHAVDGSDADAPHTAVDQHFAGAAFADATLERTVASTERMAVNRIAGLMQCLGNGVTLAALHGFAFKKKLHHLAFGDVENWVFLNGKHNGVLF